MKVEQNLTENEEKALVGLIFNSISFGTTEEIFGELNEHGIERLNLLRSIMAKFIRKFSLEKQLDEQTLLLLGMDEFLTDDILKSFSAGNNNHLKKRADYFLNRKA
ncbi:MAG: hypothetical protein A3H57_01270 [Candidatus Taylorbacteria bacterium RIFCSPLOWO2_02_FULL_43_11]|uniref:Uncharacterized protein n=1 Tax=Candidatus Taylorbacteria bacterium RIFCSPHIGHO2_02_FULL_43_32b TaxID=1802306 RepID=A0A1G2MNI8_9BACT|nr:MAG: hypothetical protein A3C72_01690 [Candidatus Taylorbacteria bacterium RIFCSPHIGHO2_02_FULL_43_32b]OHA35808.1 MAG: hypothetical protein A3H57_01270 [Candidatus Taylorbacteria bacterium RIFCSPLOWO2_02_FULL_43_11]